MKHIDNEMSPSNSEVAPPKEGWPCYREHSLLESAVTEASRELQVSREMAMMCAFGAMATACQGQVDLQMPTGHQVPASLMLLTIADSGERKTTTQNYFFEAIHTSNNSAHQAHEATLQEHEIEHQLWLTHKRHLEQIYRKTAARKENDNMDGAFKELTKHVSSEPRPARSNKFLYEDTTPQALVQMLHENAPNGCLLTSEANSIFSGKALGELDKLNTLWDGNNVIVDRISRESFILQNARLTLSLMAQPSVIARFLDKRGEEARGTGFLARFLVVRPRPMAGKRIQRKLSKLLRKQEFNARISTHLKKPIPTNRQVISFSESAADLWYEYSEQLEQHMQENGLYYYLKDHASKLLENTCRLAAILHTFERESDSDIEIDKFTLEFCWQLSKNCSRHFIEHFSNEPQLVTDTRYLTNYLLQTAYKENPTANRERHAHTRNKTQFFSHTEPPHYLTTGVETNFTLTQIKQNGPSRLRGRANTERLEAAIGLLIKLGHIEKTGGRYRFRETILLKDRAPELKNGEILTIKELPLFIEQDHWSSTKPINPYSNPTGYYINTRNHST